MTGSYVDLGDSVDSALDNGMKDPKLFDGVVERCVTSR